MTLIFLKDFRHFVGNGTHVFYEKGQTTDELDGKLASSLIFEGIASPVPEGGVDIDLEVGNDGTAETRETKVTAPEETKPKKKGKR